MDDQKCTRLNKWPFIALLSTALCGQAWGDNKQLDLPKDHHMQPALEFKSGYLFASDDKKSDAPSELAWGWNRQLKTPQPCPPCKDHQIQPVLEFKSGYFFFADDKMSDVYDEGGLDLQISGSYPVWKWLQIYGSVEYISRHGKSLHGHQKTRIWEYPLSVGLKSVVEICKSTQYYLTIGPRYFFVHVHNNSPFIDREMNENGIGGFVGTGFNFLPMEHLLIDVFGEYSYCKLHFHPSKEHTYGRAAQVGGFAFGVGIGYAF